MAESMAGVMCQADQKRFGTIPNITDKGYYTNSFHVTPSEQIDVFSKFAIEAEFQAKSVNGRISYCEIPNLKNNISAILEIMEYIYNTIGYAEFNTKSDYCQVCGFDGEIVLNDQDQWECPQCHNKDKNTLNIVRRT